MGSRSGTRPDPRRPAHPTRDLALVFLWVEATNGKGTHWLFADINLPTCGIAFVFLLITLKLNPTKKTTFAQLRSTFDFLGL
jgi:hypothetical protein